MWGRWPCWGPHVAVETGITRLPSHVSAQVRVVSARFEMRSVCHICAVSATRMAICGKRGRRRQRVWGSKDILLGN
jgi:hypothetical protein